MKGNFHVQFLGEGVAATSPPYPTPRGAIPWGHPARNSSAFCRLRHSWPVSRYLIDTVKDSPYAARCGIETVAEESSNKLGVTAMCTGITIRPSGKPAATIFGRTMEFAVDLESVPKGGSRT